MNTEDDKDVDWEDFFNDTPEEEDRFFFPSAFDFWNDAREDLYQQHIEEKKDV